MKSPYLYLASQSPRRRQLLDQMGVAHQLLLPQAHEDAEGLEALLPGESARAYVQRVTRLKLQAAMQRRIDLDLPAAPVLCADTTVALDGDSPRLLARHVKLDTRDLGWGHHIPF